MSTAAGTARRTRRAPRSATRPVRRARAGRDPLLSAICHDLRAPLAAVTMGANYVLQTLDDQTLDDAAARPRKILEAMLRSCAQMDRLIRNFADLSEIEGKVVQLRIGVHDAGEMLDLAAEAAADAARASSITLEIEKPTANVHLRCDRERMLRSLHHLIENAVKHAPEGSTVTLTVGERNGKVSFGVIDRGPGLSPQTRRNLFDRQWHAKRANRVGTGFGLAIARGFTRAHGGKLTVDSKPGSTTFAIVVPKNT